MIGFAALAAAAATALALQATPQAEEQSAPQAARQSRFTPRQVNIIRRANAVIEADGWALMSACRILNGRPRYDAARRRLIELRPALVRELGEWPVYEIFVIRAPTVNPAAIPPARCRPRRRYEPDREALMRRFEEAVEALVLAVNEAP